MHRSGIEKPARKRRCPRRSENKRNRSKDERVVKMTRLSVIYRCQFREELVDHSERTDMRTELFSALFLRPIVFFCRRLEMENYIKCARKSS